MSTKVHPKALTCSLPHVVFASWGTTMNQMVCLSWGWFTDGDGQANPKLQLSSCGKRCAWNAVCGTFTWLLSPQVSPQVALRCVFLENRTDLPCDLRQAPPHASLWNQCNKSNWLPGVIGEKSEIIPVKYLTWFITQSNYLLSIGCRYYYCSCCFIGSQGTHDRA